LQRSNGTENKNKIEDRQKAISIAKAALENYPESYGSLKCTRLLSQIYQPSLSSNLQTNVIPNQPSRGIISYQNATAATVYYMKVAQDYEEKKGNRDSIHNVSFQRALKENSFAHVEEVVLPEGDDTFSHTYEYAIPGLEKGNYLVLIKEKEQEKVTSGSFMTVSGLAMTSTNVEGKTVITATDRDTGKAIQDVSVNIYKEDRKVANYQDKTDKNGQASFFLSNSYYRNRLEAFKNGDTLYSNVYRGYFTDSKENVEKNVSAFIYLDRAIYRPGQKVYFKSIVVENQNEKSKVVAKEPFEIVIEDVNGEEVYREKLTTNAYGSVNASFTLPAETLTGSFSIYLESEEEGSFWKNVNDFNGGEKRFQVEEYKRPRFKTEFKDVTETYIVGDSVKVEGFAKALLGSNITDAQVAYTVTRTSNVPYWKYGYVPVDQQFMANDSTTTNADGTFTIPFKAIPDSILVAKEIESNYNYRIEASVTDVNGETRTAETSVRVGYKPIEIQITQIGILTVQNNEVQVLARNLNGKPIKATIEFQIRSNIDSDHIIVDSGLGEAEFHELTLEQYRNQFPLAELRKEEKIDDWKNTPIIFKTTVTTDSLTTIKIPITSQWKNGNYIHYAKAVQADKNLSLEDEKQYVEEKQDAQVSADKNLPIIPSIISHEMEVKDDQAIVNFYTSTDGVYLYLTTYDSERILESKWIYLPNGKTTMKFPMGKALGNALKFQYSAHKYNDFKAGSFEAVKPIKPLQQYVITTQTFRNKLYPGVEEEWSFTIKDQDSTGMQGEVLASMYDKSLDEFASSYWNGFSFYNRSQDFYPSSPDNLAAAGTISVYTRIPHDSEPEFLLEKEQLNLYGLTFNNFERNYRNYKNSLSRKLTPVKPIAGKIVGKITDESGELILGATIKVKGGSIAATSDFNGLYNIDATKGATLIVSYIGFTTQEVKVSTDVENITLRSDNSTLDSVVVTSYRTSAKKKSNFSSSIVTSETIENRFNAGFVQTLGGQVAGLTVQYEKGKPGASPEMAIRGIGSINGAAEPLYIIDGVPMTAAEFKSLNPGDIQEIAVLKDASATSIYGNRGANGVIVISRKPEFLHRIILTKLWHFRI
jgi:TonB-dependent SusC/RagA subfamily outer membrane receptor